MVRRRHGVVRLGLALAVVASAAPAVVTPATASSCSAVHRVSAEWSVADVPKFDTASGSSVATEVMVGQDPRTLLATDGGAVLRSVDGGCSWKAVYTVGGSPVDAGAGSPYTITNIVNSHSSKAVAGQVVYLVLTPLGFLSATAGQAAAPPELIAVSRDGGADFALIQPNVSASAPTVPQCTSAPDIALVVDPQTLYLHCAGSAIRDATATAVTGNKSWLYRSTDGGATWAQLGLPEGALTQGNAGAADASFAVDPDDRNQLWVAGFVRPSAQVQTSALAVWHSTDFGATWSRALPHGVAPAGRVPVILAVDPRGARSAVAAYDDDGTFESIDGGSRWTVLARSLTHFAYVHAYAAFFLRHALFVEQSGGVGCAAFRLSRYSDLRARPAAVSSLRPYGAGSGQTWRAAEGQNSTRQVAGGLASVLTAVATGGCNEVTKWVSYAPKR